MEPRSSLQQYRTKRMPKTFETLSLQDAKRMLAAGEAKAEQIGIPYNIAVVDAGGHLLAFSRQDGAPDRQY
jgi:uncharacterized protein GlcG (DUF336 family)